MKSVEMLRAAGRKTIAHYEFFWLFQFCCFWFEELVYLPLFNAKSGEIMVETYFSSANAVSVNPREF